MLYFLLLFKLNKIIIFFCNINKNILFKMGNAFYKFSIVKMLYFLLLFMLGKIIIEVKNIINYI